MKNLNYSCVEVVFFLLIFTSACIHQPEIKKEPVLNENIIQEWKTRNMSLKNLKTRAKIYLSTPEYSKKFNVFYIASLPNMFRIEVVSPFGQSIAGISSDGRKLMALNTSENICYRGVLEKDTFRKFIPFDVNPEIIINLLISRIPFFDDYVSVINNIESNRIEFSLSDHYRIEISFEKTPEFSVEGVMDNLSFTFKQFFYTDNNFIPGIIILKNDNAIALIEINNPVINSDLEVENFIIDFPDNCTFREEGIF